MSDDNRHIVFSKGFVFQYKMCSQWPKVRITLDSLSTHRGVLVFAEIVWHTG